MADARRRAFDVVLVWRFDRFARSVRQLAIALDEFQSLGIDFISHQEALDTSTPIGRAMFAIIGAMAGSVTSSEGGPSQAWNMPDSAARSLANLLAAPNWYSRVTRFCDCTEGISSREIARKLGVGESTTCI